MSSSKMGSIMHFLKSRKSKNIYFIIAIIFVQTLSSGFFIVDAVMDYVQGNLNFMQIVETVAAIFLVVAIIFEIQYVRMILHNQEKLERSHAILSKEFHTILESQYDEWALTASERDIATLTIKGLNIAQIADVRQNAEGTVKTHLNAIYRKSGMSGRHDLLSSLLENLLFIADDEKTHVQKQS